MATLLQFYQTVKEIKEIAEVVLTARDIPDLVNQIRDLDSEAVFLHSVDKILKQEKVFFIEKEINLEYNLDVFKKKLRKQGLNFEQLAANPKTLNIQIGNQIETWILSNDFLTGVDIGVEVNAGWAKRVTDAVIELYANTLFEKLFSTAIRQELQYISNNVKENSKILEGVNQLLDLFQNFVSQTTSDYTVLNLKTAQELFGVSASLIEFEKIKPATQERLERFYKGERLWWDVITADGDVERDLQKATIKNYELYPDSLKMLCIVGESGAGKSTFAWRVAFNISRSLNLPVIHLRNNESEEFWYLLENGIKQYGKPIIVLADDIFRDINSLRALETINPDTSVIIISTARSNELPDDLSLHINIDYIHLPPPTGEEITKALDKLNIQEELSKKISKDSTWLVLMYELTTGQELSKHIRDTVKRLRDQDAIVYRAYEYICFTGQYDIEFPTKLLERMDNDGHFFEIYKRTAANGLIFQSLESQAYLNASHALIAKFAISAYKRDPQKIADDIFKLINYEKYIERSFLVKFILALINHKSIKFAKELLKRLDKEKLHIHSLCSELISGWENIYQKLGETTNALAVKEIAYSKPIKVTRDLLVMFEEYEKNKQSIPDFPNKVINWFDVTSTNSFLWVTSLKISEDNFGSDQIVEAIHSTELWLDKHPNAKHIRGFYLGLLERKGTSKQIEEALRSTELWLNEHPNDGEVRRVYLGLVERKGASEQVEEAIRSTVLWLNEHPSDTNVRTVYLGLLERKGTSEQVDEAIRTTKLWLDEHPSEANVRTVYLGLLERKGTSEQVDEAIRTTKLWLNQHPSDPYVREFYLGLLERIGTSEQVEEAIRTTEFWLNEHPSEANVRTVYLGLLERKGTAEQVEEAIRSTELWLNEHPSEAYVREFYLSLLERKGTSEQVEEAIRSTEFWLNEHPNDENVRNVYLGLLERKGTSKQIEEAIRSTGLWLNEHPSSKHIRGYYLGLLERKGTSEQIEEAIYSTELWLNKHLSDKSVRAFYLGLVERRGTSEQIEEAIRSTKLWLNQHPSNKSIRVFYLGLLERKGISEQVEEAIRTTKLWLNEHPSDINVREFYLGLLERKGTSEQVEEAIRSTALWLNEHPSDTNVRSVYLGLLERKGTSEQVGEAIRATELWLKSNNPTKGIKAQIFYRLGILIIKENKLDDAKAAFRNALANHKGHVPSRIGLGWCLYKTGNKKGALRELKHALWWAENKSAHPVDELYFQIGKYWFLEHDYGYAKEYFEKAIQFCNNDYNPYRYYLELGRTLLILKEKEALSKLQKAKEIISEIVIDEDIIKDIDLLLQQAVQIK